MRGALGHSVDCAPEEPEKDTTEYEMKKNKKKIFRASFLHSKKGKKCFYLMVGVVLSNAIIVINQVISIGNGQPLVCQSVVGEEAANGR